MSEETNSSTKNSEEQHTKCESKEKKQHKERFSEKIEDTEFSFINHEGKVAILYRGKRMSKNVWNSIEEAEEYVLAHPWQMIEMVAVGVAMELWGAIEEGKLKTKKGTNTKKKGK